MTCIKVPIPSIPTLPPPLSLSIPIPTLPDLSDLAFNGPCCAIVIPLPSLPQLPIFSAVPPTVMAPALLVLDGLMLIIQQFLDLIPPPCPFDPPDS